MRRPRALAPLRGAETFRRVLSRGARVRTACFRARAQTCAASLPVRLGFAIGRRAVPRAVDRNRLKRLVRESARRSAASLCGLEIVVGAERCALALSNAQITLQLERLWSRLNHDRARQSGSTSP